MNRKRKTKYNKTERKSCKRRFKKFKKDKNKEKKWLENSRMTIGRR